MSMADRFLIRPAAKEDLDALVAFSRAMAFETEGKRLDRERLRRGTLAVLESTEKGFYLVAELQADTPAVVGQLLITYEWSDWRNATFWWIQSVYVDPAWRRRGVYRRLYERVLRDAQGQPDVCGLRLYVEQGNDIAQSVYHALNLHRTHYQIWEVDFVL
ncbi:MAG: GNAT family N-acetyltransferase [Nitrospiraceae bacterium]